MQALTEYLYPALSPFAFGSIPPPSTPIAYEVITIASKIVANKTSGTLPLMQDGSAADPASVGVSVVLANWTSSSTTSTLSKADFATAATEQVQFLLQDVPRSSSGAISHRVANVELW